MNISETIHEVKKELSSDEQMLASAFKAEKLYKKHKIKLFSLLAIVILYFGGTAIMNKIEEDKLIAANEAYLKLTKDPKNSSALAILENNNPALFELLSYQKAINNADVKILDTLANSKNPIIADVSSYHSHIIRKEESESKIYDEIAKINNASLLIQEGKIEEARDELDLVSEESAAYNISQMLKHYSIKGK